MVNSKLKAHTYNRKKANESADLPLLKDAGSARSGNNVDKLPLLVDARSRKNS